MVDGSDSPEIRRIERWAARAGVALVSIA